VGSQGEAQGAPRSPEMFANDGNGMQTWIILSIYYHFQRHVCTKKSLVAYIGSKNANFDPFGPREGCVAARGGWGGRKSS